MHMYWVAECATWPNYCEHKPIRFLVHEIPHVNTPAIWIGCTLSHIVTQVRIIKVLHYFWLSTVNLMETETTSTYRTHRSDTCPKLEENFFIRYSIWKYAFIGEKQKSKIVHILPLCVVAGGENCILLENKSTRSFVARAS